MPRIAVAVFCTQILIVFGNAVPSRAQEAPKKHVVVVGALAAKENQPDWEAMHAGDNRSYLAAVGHVQREYERLKQDKLWGDMLLQMLGTEYSYIGRYQKALECFDTPMNRGSKGGQKKAGQLTMADRFEPRDAIAAILDLADKHQVIMINEAHHVPLHRAFTLQLLEGLYAKGFRYFAAETLSHTDHALQTRGYPTAQTGGYTAEPVYADLVRTALKAGYKVIPYECVDSPDQIGADNPIPAMNIRDQGQAKNLKERILDGDPAAKIIIHAGYAHIAKKLQSGKQGELKWMALAFQELTGIEPFCIDQTEMTERAKPESEKADYRFAVERDLVKDRPVVLRHKQTDNYFVSTANGLIYDLSVVHPRTRYESGRPSWLSLGGRRTPHTVQSDLHPPAGSSYLAQAFYQHEMSPEAVPIDQMEYNADEPIPTLWLPTGKMHIRIVDDHAKVLHEYAQGN
jgi:hypothetical protein